MELALYHPVYGYYRRSSKQIGCQGDFYTSVSVGPLFGQLLGFQFAEWLQSLAPSSSHIQWVEAGAHDGRLARDLLTWCGKRCPALFERLEYWILEPLVDRQQLQKSLLGPLAERVRWGAGWEEFPLAEVQGVIFCNELLDAMPVFRLGWDARKKSWFEWRVNRTETHLIWARSPVLSGPVQQELATEFWQHLPLELLKLLPDGFTVEINPAAKAWWSQAAARLRAGKLMTLDYGLDADEFFAPQRQAGTLRSYRAHHLTPDPLARPGEQDLTVHVNFTALREAGEKAGLKTDCYCSQSAFLTGIASRVFESPSKFEGWSQIERRQFQTLTHPNHLGRSFRVLVQSQS